ncbi:286_t:CDS:2 [Scutellospora calospora]|uniref:286_t:CDS:1 n=1 Tax=Scutellospora calospora TaxID=85575 RepID=A0ACA9LU99_9GLOM|nr:286_t:CDS:2 [Scutellospora calospora]
MNVSFTERLMELNYARERSLISEEEYCMLRLKIFDAFTSTTSSTSTTQSVSFAPPKPQYSQPQQQATSPPPDKSQQQLTPQPSPVFQQQHVTFDPVFNQQSYSSSTAKPLSNKAKIPATQSILSSNGSIQQSPQLISRLTNNNVNNNIENDSSTPTNVTRTNLVSPVNQISIPKRTQSSLVPSILQETNTDINDEFSIPILKTTIRDSSSSSSKKNLSTNRSISLAYVNAESTSLFDHNNSTYSNNSTINVMNHNGSNNSDSINNVKNDENYLSNGKHNDENDVIHVNTSSDVNGVNYTSILNNRITNQTDERSEIIQTNVVSKVNYMNGNSDRDDNQLVSTIQPISQSQSSQSPQPSSQSPSQSPSQPLSQSPSQPHQRQQNINAATLSARHGEVMNSLNNGSDGLVETDMYEQSMPEVPPPPYSPPESSLRFHRRRTSTSFFLKPKTSTELRKELLKLTEESKKEQDNWRIEEARLRMRINSKPEEIERVKRKMRESSEKYRKKIDAVTAKLRQINSNNANGN